MNIRQFGENTELIWKDRKRRLGLPLSFTRYYLINKPGVWCKVFVDIGFFFSNINEINLYRICDIQFNQSLLGKLLNVGDVILISSDASAPRLVLRNVKNPYKVRGLFADKVEEQRRINNVRTSEFHASEAHSDFDI